jgi:hypothetical protein
MTATPTAPPFDHFNFGWVKNKRSIVATSTHSTKNSAAFGAGQ